MVGRLHRWHILDIDEWQHGALVQQDMSFRQCQPHHSSLSLSFVNRPSRTFNTYHRKILRHSKRYCVYSGHDWVGSTGAVSASRALSADRPTHVDTEEKHDDDIYQLLAG